MSRMPQQQKCSIHFSIWLQRARERGRVRGIQQRVGGRVPTLITITGETAAVRGACHCRRAADYLPPGNGIPSDIIQIAARRAPASRSPHRGVGCRVHTECCLEGESSLHNATGTRRVASARLPVPPLISTKTLSRTQRSIHASTPFGFDFQILEDEVEQNRVSPP